MINLYVMNVSPFEDSSLFSKGLSLIDEERQNKVNMLKQESTAKLSLGAGLLLLFGLNHASEQSEEKTEPFVAEFQAQNLVEHLTLTQNKKSFTYTYGPHGKPYIAGEKSIHFSLSHSGEYVLLAVSDREVGADIQQIKDVRFDTLAKHFMTEEEYGQWNREPEEARKELFYQIWAGKEAYLKLTGEGMTAGFRTVYYDDAKQTMVDSRCLENEVETIWGSVDGYQFAVCQTAIKSD